MKNDPILIQSVAGKNQLLTPVDAASADGRDEKWLQNLLAAHPELLPLEHFDKIGGPLIFWGSEIRAGNGRIDLLYVTPQGKLVIVETKLWKNAEGHRSVVGQILEYARVLSGWEYDDLKDAVKRPVEELVRAKLEEADISLSEFRDDLVHTLQNKDFLLLIVGDRLPRHITTLAEEKAKMLDFQVGMVEMKLYPLDNDRCIVVPDVVGRSVTEVTAVVRIKYDSPVAPPNGLTVVVEPPGADAPASATRSHDIGQEEFLQRVSPQSVRNIATDLAEWVTPLVDICRWGKDRKAAFRPYVGKQNYRPFVIKANGKLELDLETIQKVPPFDRPEEIEALAQQLATIPGLGLGRDDIGGWVTKQISNLAKQETLAGFKRTYGWIIGRIREA